MRFETRTYCWPKDPLCPEQNQDALAVNARRGSVAVADGVASGIFSGPWARLLTAAVARQPPPLADPDAFKLWLTDLRSEWRSQIDLSKLTIFQRPKMVDGGMSTLLWIELTPREAGEDQPPGSYRLQGFAIGDTCLFHLRGGELLRSFPITTAAEFGLNPAALRSVDRKVDHLLEFQTFADICLPDDLLVLCTDAIGLWAMQAYEAGEPIAWENYWDLGQEPWSQEIEALRLADRMRYDDSTLILLRPIEELAEQAEPETESAAGVDLHEAEVADSLDDAAGESDAFEDRQQAALVGSESAERVGVVVLNEPRAVDSSSEADPGSDSDFAPPESGEGRLPSGEAAPDGEPAQQPITADANSPVLPEDGVAEGATEIEPHAEAPESERQGTMYVEH